MYKKIIFHVSILFFSFYSAAQSEYYSPETFKYKVSGNLTDFHDSFIYFEKLFVYNSSVIDSVPYNANGSFSFSGKATEPGLYRIRLNNCYETITLVLTSTENNLKIIMDSATLVSSFYNISGAKVTEQLRAIKYKMKSYNDAFAKINGQHGNVTSPTDKNNLTKNYNQLSKEQFKYTATYADTVSNPLVAIYLLMNFVDPDVEYPKWDAQCKKFKTQNFPLAITKDFVTQFEIIRKDRFPTSEDSKYQIGETLPDISLRDTSGKIISLSSLRGKYVLVDFWASWCGPCRSENPNMVNVYKKFHDKGFEVFSISLDNERSKWINAIKNDNLQWQYHLCDFKGWDSQVSKDFHLTGIPMNYLIDPNGTVIDSYLKGDALDHQLSAIFYK